MPYIKTLSGLGVDPAKTALVVKGGVSLTLLLSVGLVLYLVLKK